MTIKLNTEFLTETALEKLSSIIKMNVLSKSESLRYQIFDLGQLLIRNDPTGERSKKWKQKVNKALEGEVECFSPFFQWTPERGTFLSESTKHHLDIRQKLDHIYYTFYLIEQYLMTLGQSVLEPDQHKFYLEELGAALNATQTNIIKDLRKMIRDYRMELPTSDSIDEMACLEKLEWQSYCCNYAIDKPQHIFSVLPNEPK